MQRTKRRARSRLMIAIRAVLFAASAALSVFLLASGYEAIFNRDLPYIHTLDSVNLSALESRYQLTKNSDQTADRYGNFGKPQTLKMPDRTLRIDIAPAILQDGNTWLARASTAHLLIPRPPRDGNIGLAVLYCRASFRTLSDTTMPSLGSNLFVDTDKNWRYIYRVTHTQTVDATQPFVLSDDGSTGRLAMICYDDKTHTDKVVEASLQSVQGVAQ